MVMGMILTMVSCCIMSLGSALQQCVVNTAHVTVINKVML